MLAFVWLSKRAGWALDHKQWIGNSFLGNGDAEAVIGIIGGFHSAVNLALQTWFSLHVLSSTLLSSTTVTMTTLSQLAFQWEGTRRKCGWKKVGLLGSTTLDERHLAKASTNQK
eukprot:5171040-Amphidinium_carterae.1